MTDGYSIFGSSFQHASSQPPVANLDDFFAIDPANTAASCSHRKLQEVLNSGNPMTTIANIGHAEQTKASQTIAASNCDDEIERLKGYAPFGVS